MLPVWRRDGPISDSTIVEAGWVCVWGERGGDSRYSEWYVFLVSSVLGAKSSPEILQGIRLSPEGCLAFQK